MTETVFLIDTNVWLERLLGQDRSSEVGVFLERTPSSAMAMTDFSLHSIGVILGRLKRHDVLGAFVEDLFGAGEVTLVRLEPMDASATSRAMERFGLDFDDAYQYVAAEKNGLLIVSFDSDFDGTDLGRKTPGEVT